MIKIKLYESEIHRNETTFRPFLKAINLFRDVGIEFTNSDDYDYEPNNVACAGEIGGTPGLSSGNGGGGNGG